MDAQTEPDTAVVHGGESACFAVAVAVAFTRSYSESRLGAITTPAMQHFRVHTASLSRLLFGACLAGLPGLVSDLSGVVLLVVHMYNVQWRGELHIKYTPSQNPVPRRNSAASTI